MNRSHELILLTAVLIFSSFYFYDDYFYRRYIPEEIELGHRISITTESGVFEGCGTAVYLLNEETAREIESEGLVFFENLHSVNRDSGTNSKWESWLATPRENWTRLENWQYELNCGGEIEANLFNRIVAGSTTKGAYYSLRDGAVLMVLPKQKMVVFSYRS